MAAPSQQQNNRSDRKSRLRLCVQYGLVSACVLLFLLIARRDFFRSASDDVRLVVGNIVNADTLVVRLDSRVQPSDMKQKSRFVFPEASVRFIDGDRKSGTGDNEGIVRVLSWTRSPDGDAHWFEGLEPTCEISDGVTCVYTSDPDEYEQSDAVLMTLNEYPDLGFPQYRYQSQKWIYVHTGSVDDRPWIAAHAQLYNTSSTWSSSKPPKLQGSPPMKASLVTFLNKCDVTSDTQSFIRELSAFVKVDVYGECGNRTCRHPSECESLISNYQFYLVTREETATQINREDFIFQNSAIIPVIRDRTLADQLKLPARSFLQVGDSDSTYGRYLRDVGEDAERYSEMVRIKYELIRLDRYFCDLCRGLHLNRNKKQVIDDIRDIHL